MDTRRNTINKEEAIASFSVPYPSWRWFWSHVVLTLVICIFVAIIIWQISWETIIIGLIISLLSFPNKMSLSCTTSISFYRDRIDYIHSSITWKRTHSIKYDCLKVFQKRFGNVLVFKDTLHFSRCSLLPNCGWSKQIQQEVLDFLSTFQDGRFKPNPK